MRSTCVGLARASPVETCGGSASRALRTAHHHGPARVTAHHRRCRLGAGRSGPCRDSALFLPTGVESPGEVWSPSEELPVPPESCMSPEGSPPLFESTGPVGTCVNTTLSDARRQIGFSTHPRLRPCSAPAPPGASCPAVWCSTCRIFRATGCRAYGCSGYSGSGSRAATYVCSTAARSNTWWPCCRPRDPEPARALLDAECSIFRQLRGPRGGRAIAPADPLPGHCGQCSS